MTDETLLRYGAMQIDVFTLLTEARQRLVVNIAAIETQRDFWLASTNLGAAVAGGGVAAGGGAISSAAVNASGVTAGEGTDKEIDMLSRRRLLGATAGLAGANAIRGRVQATRIPRA